MANEANIGQTNNSTNGSIDPNNPLYIHPSDNPGAMLVPVPFAGIGYRSWRRSVLRSLSVKNKLGFINGECPKPLSDHQSYRQWVRCDDIVTSWILNSLSKEIEDSVEYVEDSAELWKELEDRYEQTNGAKLYQIQKEINDLSQGSLDITGYYTKLKKLWEELSTLSAKTQCTCNCTCGAKVAIQKGEQDRRLVQFLMGLNETYTVIRGSILMMNPLPSMAQAFSRLVQDEHQREIKHSNHLSLESTALYAGNGKIQGYKTNYSPNNMNTSSQSHYKERFCDYCKRSGHLREKCYLLHGYPNNNNTNARNNDAQTQKSNGFRPPPKHNQNNSRNSRGNGNRTVANVNCTQDLGTEKGTTNQHEDMYNMSLTKDQ